MTDNTVEMEPKVEKISSLLTSDRSDWSGRNDVQQLIKLQGTPRKDGEGLNYEIHKGSFVLQNNFITGQVKMQGNGGGAYPTNYLALIDTIFGAEPNTIEVCSKTIHGGCFTVDLNADNKPDLVVDGQTLEGIKDNVFNRWRADPPYSTKAAKEMYNTDLPDLGKLLKAGARVIKPGSLMFLLCNQNRQASPSNVKRIGFITISVVPMNEIRICNIYVKLDGEKKKEGVESDFT